MPVPSQGLQLSAKFFESRLEQLGAEDSERFGQGAQRDSTHAQTLLDLFQFAGLLHGPQTVGDGIEQAEELGPFAGDASELEAASATRLRSTTGDAEATLGRTRHRGPSQPLLPLPTLLLAEMCFFVHHDVLLPI